MIKTGRTDILLQLFYIRLRKGFDRRIFHKQIFRDNVDPCVGALRAQHRRDQKLPGVFMVEVADIFSSIVGVELIQNGFRVCVQSAAPFPVTATASASAAVACPAVGFASAAVGSSTTAVLALSVRRSRF